MSTTQPSVRAARYWSSTYRDLLQAEERMLAALESLAARQPAGSREQLERADILLLREVIAYARDRLAFWEGHSRREPAGTGSARGRGEGLQRRPAGDMLQPAD
jgi:hypothetical protein